VRSGRLEAVGFRLKFSANDPGGETGDDESFKRMDEPAD
jgi:hypothetical protein